MKEYRNQYFEGERILYGLKDARLTGITFGQGESPLKEARNIQVNNSIFKWKYPLWYDNQVKVDNTTFETMSRSGIWYTKNIRISNSALQAPKLFRRAQNIELDHVFFSDAAETMWTCQRIKMSHCQVNGDYFGKDSQDVHLDGVTVVGNYVFDGGQNIEAHHCNFVSKDAFWNCRNVTIYDSTLDGEYLAWNSQNVTFINCQIESDQGLNYIDHLTIKNSALIHTDLAFEYVSHLDAEVNSTIQSVKNPISGRLQAPEIETLIMDAQKIDPRATTIACPRIDRRLTHSDQNQEAKEG